MQNHVAKSTDKTVHLSINTDVPVNKATEQITPAKFKRTSFFDGSEGPFQKGLILVAVLPSAISEEAVYAAPPPQQWKAAPPGTLLGKDRSDPRSSDHAWFITRDSLNRIGSASPLPQPVLRCKRRS